MFDPATLAFHAREASVYVGSRPDDPDRDLPDFLDLLPTGAETRPRTPMVNQKSTTSQY
jgi:hypothetical protein